MIRIVNIVASQMAAACFFILMSTDAFAGRPIVIDVSLELEMGLNYLVVKLRGGVLHVDAVPILPSCNSNLCTGGVQGKGGSGIGLLQHTQTLWNWSGRVDT